MTKHSKKAPRVKVEFADEAIKGLFEASPILTQVANTIRDVHEAELERQAELETNYSPACLAMLRSRGII